MSTKQQKKKSEANDASSRQLLIDAAKRVFANQGYDGSTVKDIADAAGVNISLVSYHFDGKENLYRTCLETFGQSNIAAAERALKAPSTKEEFKVRLQLFFEEFIALNQSEPDVCRILQRDFEKTNPVALDVFKKSFVPIYDTLQNFVAAAKKAKLLGVNVDVDVTTALIFGSVVHLIRMDGFRQKVFGESFLDKKRLDFTIRRLVEHSLFGVFGGEE